MTLPMIRTTAYDDDLATIKEFGDAASVHAIAELIRERSLDKVPYQRPAYTTVHPTRIVHSEIERSIRWVPISLIVLGCCFFGGVLWFVARASARAVESHGGSILLFLVIVVIALLVVPFLRAKSGGRGFSGTFEGRFH